MMKKFLKIARILWVTFGIAFILWMTNSFRAQGFDKSILDDDELVSIEETGSLIHFQPTKNERAAGLIFLPGGMVQPQAYAPMAGAIAEQGFNVYIVKLPFGAAPLESQEISVREEALEIMKSNGSIQHWVVGGHSRGAAIAARFAKLHAESFDGLVLIGTSHPKDAAFDLSNGTLAVTKIYASNDGLASMQEVESNAVYLPRDTTWVLIDGGNHSQFGYYGSQMGDGAATISREEQQALTVQAILEALQNIQDK